MSGVKRSTVRTTNHQNIRSTVHQTVESLSREFQSIINRLTNSNSNQEQQMRRMSNDFQRRISNMEQRANQKSREFQQISESMRRKQQTQNDEFISLNRNLSNVKEEQKKKLQQMQTDLTNQNRKHNNDLNELNEKIKSSEKVVKQELIKQRSELLKEMKNQEFRLKSEIEQNKIELQRNIQKVELNLNHKIEEVNRKFTHEINTLKDSLQKKEAKEQTSSSTWLDACNEYIEILKEKRHELFANGELSTIVDKYNRTAKIHNQGTFQTSYAQAINIFDELTLLDDKVNAREIEWQTLYDQLTSTLSHLRVRIDELKEIEFSFTTFEGITTLDGEVDYWTKGKLTDLEDRFVDFVKELQSKKSQLTIENLHQEIGKTEELFTCSKNLENEAKDKIISSNSRIQTTQLIDMAVQHAGYSTNANNYTFRGDDKRNEFVTKFSDGLGNDIVVVVSPDENDAEINNIEINFFDDENDEKFHWETTKDIYEIIQSHGLKISKPVSEKGYETRSSDKHHLKEIETIKNSK